MPAYIGDLHIHTPLEPGYAGGPDVSGRDLVAAALDAGLDIIAVTDHFSCAFVPQVLKAAETAALSANRTLLVVPGVELGVRWRGEHVHVTALFSPDDYRDRVHRLFEMLGLAPASVEQPAKVGLEIETDPPALCRAIRELGGIAIVAHADGLVEEYESRGDGVLAKLLEEPALAAIEMVKAGNADQLYGFRVAAIASSNSHSLDEIGRRRTLLAMRELSFDELSRALYRASTVHLGPSAS